MTTLTVRRFATHADLDAALQERLRAAICAPGPAAIMLAGGTTPMAAYRALARQVRQPTPGLCVFFSDERYVPADSDHSNYHQADPLLQALQQAGASIVRVRTELPLQAAAAEYAQQLDALLNAAVPIRLGLLGLGADGHTASLFSAADLARAAGRLAITVQRPDGLSAVSVTPTLLERFGELLIVTAAAGKADALRRLQAGDPALPAWHAVSGREQVALWIAEDPAQRADSDSGRL